jgi:glucokinase
LCGVGFWFKDEALLFIPFLLQCEKDWGSAMILAGDIGGTNTRLALFETEGDLKILFEEKYPSREFAGLEQIVLKFLEDHKAEVSVACFGVAGPVQDGRCKTTNLPWIVDAELLSKGLKIPSVRLYNDLQANANGLKVLKSDELYCIQAGSNKQKANRALIAAGTGLGEAGLFWDGKNHIPFASEGGHTDFAPRNELEIALFGYMQAKFGHISYERIISGPGIHSLYEFLVEVHEEKQSQDVIDEMKERDPVAVICEFAIRKKDPLCEKVVAWFLSLYGAESGNMALKYFSLGGFYIGGGIAPRLLKLFKDSEFLSSFSKKGRFKELLESIPIYIVLNDNAALLGAASYGRQ